MKKIVHMLDGEFLHESRGTRPDHLQADIRVWSGAQRLVRLEFNTLVNEVLLLPSEARDLASSLCAIANEAEGEK